MTVVPFDETGLCVGWASGGRGLAEEGADCVPAGGCGAGASWALAIAANPRRLAITSDAVEENLLTLTLRLP